VNVSDQRTVDAGLIKTYFQATKAPIIGELDNLPCGQKLFGCKRFELADKGSRKTDDLKKNVHGLTSYTSKM